MFYNVLVGIFLLSVETFCLKDYYWKDYTGKIPEDAFPAGHDVNHHKTYVGLVFLGNEGIIPATIYPGEKITYAAASDVEKSQNYVQILCTENRGNLRWMPSNKTDFHFITMGKHLVRGGIQTSNWLHIGRVNYQGEMIIGKVMSGRAPINDAFMNYVHNGEKKVAYSYEVLTFVEPETDAEFAVESILE